MAGPSPARRWVCVFTFDPPGGWRGRQGAPFGSMRTPVPAWTVVFARMEPPSGVRRFRRRGGRVPDARRSARIRLPRGKLQRLRRERSRRGTGREWRGRAEAARGEATARGSAEKRPSHGGVRAGNTRTAGENAAGERGGRGASEASLRARKHMVGARRMPRSGRVNARLQLRIACLRRLLLCEVWVSCARRSSAGFARGPA